ncbi:EI24 domain-containing protein [Uliginosibacterium sp. H3]|uniref:EI24 domain-containing protein n=1 Tax=Uliginosibacterium silvisoli TaxID=3114758 RepID=A0ABU6K5V4_9RHOO|nr:EI24 domain-containing protein [Uliginosibacterium sp. H3]
MSKLALAWTRAARSLMRPDVMWHLLWPTLVAFVAWLIAAVLVWGQAAELLVRLAQGLPWVGSWFVAGSTSATVLEGFTHVLLILLLLPLSLLTATVLISLIALPLMLDRVATTDYPELVERRGGSQIGSAANAVWALMLFLVLGLCSLPLWFIPGMGVVLSVCLSAWLNQRCYRYDVLMRHADRNELRTLPRQHRGALYAIGGVAGVLVFVPVFNLFVPALSGLAFVHYLLQALRESRAAERIIDVTDARFSSSERT